jgi:flagellar motility protein MotE (MotC chaperone)
MLRNVEDEYAVAARALVSCRAGESIAEQVHEQPTADLLGSLRRQDEELLEALEDSLAEHAQAVAAAANGRRLPQGNGGGRSEAVTRTVRTAADRLQDAVRTGSRRARGAAEGAVREMPRATRMAQEVQGAVTREEDLPITRFSQLSIDEIQRQLRTLSQTELTVIEGYEHTHANRPGVLEAIEQLRGSEPWAGYHAMDPDQIAAQLQNVASSVARQVLEYERRHHRREKVISAAEARVPG